MGFGTAGRNYSNEKLQNYGCKLLPNPNKPAEDVAFDAFVSAVIKIWSISLLFSILAKHA